MICNMLEKIQAEFSRLEEVGYNSVERGVHCHFSAEYSMSVLYSIRIFIEECWADTRTAQFLNTFSSLKLAFLFVYATAVATDALQCR